MDAPGYGKPAHEYGQPVPADLDPGQAPSLTEPRAGPGFTKPNEESSQ